MRRALLAVLAGGLLLPMAACDRDSKTTTQPAGTSALAPRESMPPLPDYSADTQQVCSRLQTVYTGELAAFGTALGQMVSYKEAKQAPDAKKAADQAAAKLKAAGSKILQTTSTAEDPEFKSAGQTSAAKFDQSATDRKYLNQVNTLKDLNGTLKPQMAQWLSPVSAYCPS